MELMSNKLQTTCFLVLPFVVVFARIERRGEIERGTKMQTEEGRKDEKSKRERGITKGRLGGEEEKTEVSVRKDKRYFRRIKKRER